MQGRRLSGKEVLTPNACILPQNINPLSQFIRTSSESSKKIKTAMPRAASPAHAGAPPPAPPQAVVPPGELPLSVGTIVAAIEAAVRRAQPPSPPIDPLVAEIAVLRRSSVVPPLLFSEAQTVKDPFLWPLLCVRHAITRSMVTSSFGLPGSFVEAFEKALNMFYRSCLAEKEYADTRDELVVCFAQVCSIQLLHTDGPVSDLIRVLLPTFDRAVLLVARLDGAILGAGYAALRTMDPALYPASSGDAIRLLAKEKIASAKRAPTRWCSGFMYLTHSHHLARVDVAQSTYILGTLEETNTRTKGQQIVYSTLRSLCSPYRCHAVDTTKWNNRLLHLL